MRRSWNNRDSCRQLISLQKSPQKKTAFRLSFTSFSPAWKCRLSALVVVMPMLVNNRTPGDHHVRSRGNRRSEPRTTKCKEIAAAGRAANDVINIKGSNEADKDAGCGSACSRTRLDKDRMHNRNGRSRRRNGNRNRKRAEHGRATKLGPCGRNGPAAPGKTPLARRPYGYDLIRRLT